MRDGLVRKGHRKRDAEVHTTLIVGALSGLQMLKLSGADSAEIDAAFRLLVKYCSEVPAG
ncbi:MAG TPA: hypothetical protein VJV78_13380 [Polyangiales bacterium]|nr:hypothetical protein [Polyangiales bacterium]